MTTTEAITITLSLQSLAFAAGVAAVFVLFGTTLAFAIFMRLGAAMQDLRWLRHIDQGVDDARERIAAIEGRLRSSRVPAARHDGEEDDDHGDD